MYVPHVHEFLTKRLVCQKQCQKITGDVPIIGQILNISLIGAKIKYWLKFSRYYRCIQIREYIVILVAKYLSF